MTAAKVSFRTRGNGSKPRINDKDRPGVLTDKNCTTHNSGNAAAQEAVQHHRKRFVNDDVGEQQGDEHPMLSAVEQREDSFCVFVLRFVGVAG